jgi:hypothetical protein
VKEKVAKAHGCVAAKWPSLASYGDGAVMVISRLPQRRRTIPLTKRRSWHSSGNLHMLFPP